MNNKILARVIAAVMAVAMLGTVSFAATESISQPDINAGSEYYTVLAFTSTTITTDADEMAALEPAEEDIVAIVQQTEGYPATLDIDDSKMPADGEALYVRYGGSNGEYTTLSIKAPVSIDTASVILKGFTVEPTVTIGDQTWKDVVTAVYEIPLKSGTELASYGMLFGKYGDSEKIPFIDDQNKVNHGTPTVGRTAVVEGDITEETVVSGNGTGGTFKFRAVITGVPLEKMDGSQGEGDVPVTAYAYATYNEVK